MSPTSRFRIVTASVLMAFTSVLQFVVTLVRDDDLGKAAVLGLSILIPSAIVIALIAMVFRDRDRERARAQSLEASSDEDDHERS